jgi:mannose-6-phosphate isomerase-like protein (cupin superfamily)
MIYRKVNKALGKGWFCGPWDSGVPAALGYANAGINEVHSHSGMYEVYMVAVGSSTAVVNGSRVALAAGDMLVVEPGEEHTFTESSPDYLHYVVQTPWLKGDKKLGTG